MRVFQVTHLGFGCQEQALRVLRILDSLAPCIEPEGADGGRTPTL